jgi:hypothetical protein
MQAADKLQENHADEIKSGMVSLPRNMRCSIDGTVVARDQ